MKPAGTARRRISARERRRQTAVNTAPWLVVLAFGWWLTKQDYDVSISAPFPSRASMADLPELAFMAGDAPAGRDDARRILSPAVFALPGASGFSAPLENEPAGSMPPAPPSAPVAFIRDGASFTPAAYGETRVTLDELIDLPRGLARPEAEPLAASLTADDALPTPGLSLAWSEANGLALPGLDALGLPAATSSAPWQATASICFDTYGFASQVLLERPSPEGAVNDALARGLRTTFYDAPPGEPCRRLVIRFQPALNTAAAAP